MLAKAPVALQAIALGSRHRGAGPCGPTKEGAGFGRGDGQPAIGILADGATAREQVAVLLSQSLIGRKKWVRN